MKKVHGFVFSQTQKVFLGISVVLLFIAGAGYLFTSQNEASLTVIVPAVKNEAFIVELDYGKKQLTTTTYSAEAKKILSTKQIPLDDYLASSSTNVLGANDAVQYNPTTKDIFFLTNGSADMGGICVNKDGSCVSRLYRIGNDESFPKVIFESEKISLNWVVNSFDDSILLSHSEASGSYLTKISAETGKVIFARNLEVGDHEGLGNFVVSADGKYTYQASTDRGDGASSAHLRLRIIDNTNGNLTNKEIFTGSVLAETNISPDNRYFAFYVEGASIFTPKLNVFDLKNTKLAEIPYEGEVVNRGLRWSGDSSKLIQILRQGLVSYDLTTKTTAKLPVDSTKAPYVFAWGPSKDLILYMSTDKLIKMFDVNSGSSTIIPIATTDTSGVNSATWY